MTEATRFAFGKELLRLADEREDFVVCNADTKACGIENLGQKHPDRSFSIGIAEQNFIDVAAGLAAEGFKVFACTFAVFATMRCCEQVRTFVCYPNLNVTIVGTHAGLQVGEDGATHAAIEDVAIMRALPNMTVVQPADAFAARSLAQAALDFQGPLYVRLHRNPSPLIYDDSYRFRIGQATLVRDYGHDVVLVCSGILLAQALEAAEALRQQGIGCQVLDAGTIKPLDKETIVAAARTCGAMVTVEDHSVIGGLGSAVAELLGEEYPCPLQRVGVPDVFGESGKAELLYAKHHMDAAGIQSAVRSVLARK